MTQSTYIVDLDDFHEKNCPWDLLMGLKGTIPDFKVTLFAIPGRCSKAFVQDCLAIPWIDLVPHGWMHRSSTESLKWNKEQMLECLGNAERVGFTTRGFKAPGWQISNACYEGLLEWKYWVADQSYNNRRRPPSLPVYLLDSPYKIHGHVGSRMDNDLQHMIPQLLGLKNSPFGFARDYLKQEPK